MGLLVYFSSATENTKRFVERVGVPALRIPLHPGSEPLLVDEEYVLMVPSYGGGDTSKAVPKQVIKFLNVEHNRNLCRGVISSGNINFGEAYCIAGKVLSRKLKVPFLYKFELLGTPEDVTAVRKGLEEFWANLHSQQAESDSPESPES
ncbi:class Ib ribonucleoside-diphosphate reductase assembly flavoprotein NrdI [uncultured Mobiluncus sp.]|uniref:class Ib ribonucleoside-diphosphate reductase assembly flavoprotein NrdI n=1 Tax=uncultured Mobiluncus sp. TaxID=293425 RepID=UPI0027D97754|nr:class Ib ribonucleoside-diphosphate reductase assembly flavoprotein NrdI [uncultured Mobiluncus sp.]